MHQYASSSVYNCQITEGTLVSINIRTIQFISAVPNLFDSRDWFFGRQFFHRWSREGSGGNASNGEQQMELHSLAQPLTVCCLAQVPVGHGPPPVLSWRVEDPCIYICTHTFTCVWTHIDTHTHRQTYIYNGILLRHKKRNNAVHKNMDGPRDYHTTCNQSEYNFLYVEYKKLTREQKHSNRKQIHGYQRGRWERDKLGVQN